MRFYFSAAVTFRSYEFLKRMPDYRPLNLLHTQYERSHIDKVKPYIDSGDVNPLFIDSGAFSVHTGKVEENIEEYVDYLNEIDDYVHLAAQFDEIPGTYRRPKTPEDYIFSAERSWENFLQMYEGMKSPQKLLYVYHQGENISNLHRALEWKDSDGNSLGVVGISGQNDSSEKMKNDFIMEAIDVVQHSSNPKCKTHLFGSTNKYIVNGVQPYSVDSTTHLQIGIYGKIFTPMMHQPVIVSAWQLPQGPDPEKEMTPEELDRAMQEIEIVTKNKRGTAPQNTLKILPYKGGEEVYKEVERYVNSLNLTMKEVTESPYVRTAVNIYYWQRQFDHITDLNVITHKKSRKLF
jgi:hypothetical protein